jgi:RHS repeat-associated protein
MTTARSSLRTWGVLVALAASTGCHRKQEPVAKQAAALSNAQVTSARAAGYIPSLTAPYAAIELFDDPVSIPSNAAPCVSGSSGGSVLINNSGVVTGFDCRAVNHFGPQSAAVETPVYSDPSGGSTLSNTAINHAPTYALPIPSSARSVFPTFINDAGIIAGYLYTATTNTWGPYVEYAPDHTLASFPSAFPAGATPSWMSGDSSPLILGSGTNAGVSQWFTFDTAGAGSPTWIPNPSGFASGSTGGANRRGDVVGAYQKADGTWWANAYENGTWVDINSAITGTNPFARIESLRIVNDNRQAVGYGLLSGSTSSVWYRRGVKVDLNTHTITVMPNAPLFSYSGQDHVPKSINAKGHVVGTIPGANTFAGPANYPQGHAFVWTYEWGTRDLNSFVSPSLGLTLAEGYAINDNDEVVGLHSVSGTYRLFRMKIDVNSGGPEFFEPTDGKDCTVALGINASGVVTGSSYACGAVPYLPQTPVVPFATKNGVPTVLGAVSGAVVHSFGINDAGIVAANAYNSSATPQYQALSYSGGFSAATSLPFSSVDTEVMAVSDGELGAIFAGDAIGADGHKHFYSYQNSTTQVIDAPASGTDLAAYTDGTALAVNDQGSMVGYYEASGQRIAAIWTSSGGLKSLSSLLPANSNWTSLTAAYGVNNSGQVVGFGTYNNGGTSVAHTAFVMDTATGTITKLPTVDQFPSYVLHAHAINTAGHVVGTAGTPDSQSTSELHLTGARAFFYTPDSGVTDLNSLVNVPPGWYLADASAINDSDEVVGYAIQTSTGVRRAYKVKVALPPSSDCTGKQNGALCNDLNRCTQSDTCVNGVCTGGNPVVCAAPDQCHNAGVCQTTTGACTYTNKTNGTTCNDGSACTTQDACSNGVCSGTAVVCYATDQCHSAGTCDPSAGCLNPPVQDGTTCNDNNACTQNEVCSAGVCTSGTQTSCAPGDVCHTATCNANAGAPVYPSNGLVGLWHLDGNGKDASDGANHFSQAVGDVVTGISGQAYKFDRGCFSASGNTSNDLARSPGVSFVAWVNPTGTCAGAWPVYRRGTEFGVQLSCTGSGAPGVSVAVNTGGGFTYSSAFGSVPQGQWSQIAVTWDKQTARIYVNGSEVGNFARTGNLAPDLSGGQYIGCYTTNFAGTIDEVAAYGRALSAAEIAAVGTFASACKTAPKCADGPCTTGVCDPGTGTCSTQPKMQGTSCDDGNPCTQGDSCDDQGTCSPGTTPTSCATPSAPCDESTCDPKFAPIAASDYIAQWHFDGDFTDATGAGNDATNGATEQLVSGKFGQAIYSTPPSACMYVQAAPANNLNSPRGLTFSTWVKPDAGICPFTGTRILLDRDREFGVGIACRADNTVGVSYLINLTDQYSWSPAVGTLPAGQWSHIAVTWDRSLLDVFVNGQYVTGALLGNNSDLLHYAGSIVLGCTLGAAMDEPALIRRALTLPEIVSLYQSPTLCNVHPKSCAPTDGCHVDGTCNPSTGQCVTGAPRPDGSLCSNGSACKAGETCSSGACQGGTDVTVTCAAPPNPCLQSGVCDATKPPEPPANGRIGWWRFEGNTRDSSGNGADLTNIGGQLSGGKVGAGWEFNGHACLQTLTPPAAFNLSHAAGMTMMAWVREDPSVTCPVPGGYNEVMSKGWDYGLATGCWTTGSIGTTGGTCAWGTSCGTSYPGIGGNVTPGTWKHIAFTYDHNQMAQYVDGQLVAGAQIAMPVTSAASPVFNIGCYTALGNPGLLYAFKGIIDEAVLYNRVLSPAELQAYVAASNTAACTYAPQPSTTSCSDGNPCTSDDRCSAGTCVGGPPVTCATPGVCQKGGGGTCNPSTGCAPIVAADDGTGCDDGNACTQVDACMGGVCTGGSPVVCPAGDACHSGSACDKHTGTCSQLLPVESVACMGGTFDYDRAGRLVRDHATTLVYDAYDQLRGVVPGPSDGSSLALTKLPVEDLAIPSGLTSANVDAENAAGQVTGDATASDGKAHTLYWSGPGAAVDVSAAGGIEGDAYPSGVNSSGTIVGSRHLQDGSWEPYVVTPSSAPNGVPAVTYPGKDGPGDTYPYAVNASGEFAGYHGAFFGPRQAFRYTPGAGYVEIPGFGGTWIDAWGIDDAGNVFGNSSLPDTPMQNLADPIHFGHALEFHSDTQQSEDLNTLVDPVASPGWVLFTAHDVVGEYVYGLGRLDGTDLAYRLNKVTGEVVPIGPLGGTMLVNRANHFGDVVGTGWKQAGFVDQTAWAYIHDQFIDLNDVIDPMSGWHLIAANDINDNGDVVGRGTLNGVQKAFRLRLPLRTAGGKGPTVAEAHTYGYDGLRTSTTTMNVDGSNVKSQYWFSQDYTETTGGNREHYVRIGSRIVAKVIMKPGAGGAFVPPVSLTSKDKDVDRNRWPQLGLAAVLMLLGVAGAAVRFVWKKRGWVPATAALLALIFTATSCEMFGVGDKVASAIWHTNQLGDDAPRYFHSGIAPGPTVITKTDGTVSEERRYEPFGQPVDSRTSAMTTGGANFAGEPQNILGKLTDPNTGWSYHGARWMAPQVARWSAPDPEVKGPAEKHMYTPWDLNPYAYVRQSPTLYWDPSGAFSLEIHGAITSAALQNAEQQGGRWYPSLKDTMRPMYVMDTVGQLQSRFHFDNSDFKGGMAWVDKNLSAYRTSIASAPLNLGEQSRYMRSWSSGDAGKSLGQALHTIQDFYAHSTFVASFNEYAAQKKISAPVPTFEQVFDKKNTHFNENAGFRDFLKAHPIQTGRFDVFDHQTWHGNKGHGVVNNDDSTRCLNPQAQDVATRASSDAIQTGHAFEGVENAPFGPAVQ